MKSEVTVYLSCSTEVAERASRFACERYLENGFPVLLFGSAKAHAGISAPSQVILNSKISRGYSFNIIDSSIIEKISQPFNRLNSLSLSILMGLQESEAYQLDLVFKIADFQQREIKSIYNLQSCVAWLIANFFELPSWYGQLSLNSLSNIQKKLFILIKYSNLFAEGSFSFADLRSKDYLGYGVCNLIDTDQLSQEKVNFILACLLEVKAEEKPALVIENLQNFEILELISKQQAFSSVSITTSRHVVLPMNVQVINADNTELLCRSELSTKKTIEVEATSINESNTIPKIGALLWNKAASVIQGNSRS